MKNVLKLGLLALVTGSLVFSACKKDSKSPEELLKGADWLLVSYEYKDAGETVWTPEPFDACELDNFFTFGDNGIATTDEGPTKCDPTDPQTDTVPYVFSGDGKTLAIDGETYAVDELTASKMVISYNDGGDLERATFKAK